MDGTSSRGSARSEAHDDRSGDFPACRRICRRVDAMRLTAVALTRVESPSSRDLASGQSCRRDVGRIAPGVGGNDRIARPISCGASAVLPAYDPLRLAEQLAPRRTTGAHLAGVSVMASSLRQSSRPPVLRDHASCALEMSSRGSRSTDRHGRVVIAGSIPRGCWR